MTTNRSTSFLDELCAAPDARAAGALVRAFENTATPLEFAEAVANRGALPPKARRALTDSIAASIAVDEAERYWRIEIAEGVQLYADPDTPKSEKMLVVAFAGAAKRMMLPAPVFLQALPTAGHDCLLLTDRAKYHFQRGILGYASTLAELVARLREDMTTEQYRSVVTIGSSMGGFPALRAGALLPAARAISLGGRRMWHVQRLLRQERYDSALAFEPLCPCGPPSPQLVCVYSKDSDLDAASARSIVGLRPVKLVEPKRTREHNVLHAQWRAGHLKSFLANLIHSDPIKGSRLAQIDDGAATDGLASPLAPPHLLL